jgi:hypothetical protein
MYDFPANYWNPISDDGEIPWLINNYNAGSKINIVV